MGTKTSLEFLLQTLVNSPEEDKRSLTRSAVAMLRDVCNMHTSSKYEKFQHIAFESKKILDQILIGKVEDEGEEEFLESAGEVSGSEKVELNNAEKNELSKKTQEILVSKTSSAEENPFMEIADQWNAKVEPWFQIHIYSGATQEENIINFINEGTGVRANLVSAATVSQSLKEDLKRFDRYWKIFVQKASEKGYEVFPPHLGKISTPEGSMIYCCRSQISEQDHTLLLPGLRLQGKEISKPLTLAMIPMERDFPKDHVDKDLPAQWRAVLGEVELLIHTLETQKGVVCAIETINKNGVEPYSQCKQVLINEIRRRADALRSAIKNEETIYRIATNYWRVEECFWGVFHGDHRPTGYSAFDRIRRHLQAWRNIIRLENQLFLRDFTPGVDTLTSVNKYVNNVILQTKEGVSSGQILRELRPAIIVKVNNTTRLLKGRVIAT